MLYEVITVIDYGADGPADTLPIYLEGPVDSNGYVLNNDGKLVTSNGEKLVYIEDGNGGLIAVLDSDHSAQIFRVTLNQTSSTYNNTYTVEVIGTIDGQPP